VLAIAPEQVALVLLALALLSQPWMSNRYFHEIFKEDKKMSILFTDPGPKLIVLLLTVLLGFLAWGFWRHRKYQKNSVHFEWNDTVLIGFLLFASFTLGIFLTYFSFYAVP